MLAIVDMEVSNLQSVVHAFERVGAPVKVAATPAALTGASGIVLPGVGAFGEGMARLREKGFVESLRQLAREDRTPLLGICLGMQVLVNTGEEHGVHDGLGLIAGRVVRLKRSAPDCRVPNMGWCDVHVVRPSRLFSHTPPMTPFYFAHSYAVVCDDETARIATIECGGPLTAAVEQGNIFGVQFHPEKSQDAGLDVLARFAEIARRDVAAA